jgi:DNA (cytosine-5)-methyltransferase 1
VSKPVLLDLFCGAGGAAAGYARAGFDVIGLDINPQPHYPFRFWQGDSLQTLRTLLVDGSPFDAIHASPPCQAYTRKNANWGRKRTHWIEHPDLLAPVRELLKGIGAPYVIENVVGAPIDAQLMLCGSMFDAPGDLGLRLTKHRLFEANWPLPLAPASCAHDDSIYNPWAGKGRSAEKLRDAQGTPWVPMSGGASRKAGVTGDLFNAIPPAYTEYIGKALLAALDLDVAA